MPVWSRFEGLPGVERIAYRGPRQAMPAAVVPLQYGIAFFEGGYDVARHGKIRHLRAGVYCAEPGEVIAFHARGPILTRIEALNVEITTMQQVAAEVGVRGSSIAFRDCTVGDPALRVPFAQLWNATGASSKLYVQSAFYELLRVVFEVACETRPLKERAGPHLGLNRARDLMLAGPEVDLSLDDLVAQAGLAKTYFVRAFRRRFGVPPHTYLMHVRLERARGLIRAGLRPIDAAAESGFFDQSHLNRWFAKVMGVTPSAYARAVGSRSFTSIAP